MEEHSTKWELKHERPDKIPGCQDMSQLHRLEPRKTDCEGQQCFYYTCKKCMPNLILEKFNPQYETELNIVPRVSATEKPLLFKKDPGYHGEMVEFYANYMERQDSLTGIAVRGWSNTAARKIFNSVDKTFERKNPKQNSQNMGLQKELEEKLKTCKKRKKPREILESQKVVVRRRCRSAQKRRTTEKTGLSERSKSVGSPSNATTATKNVPRDFEIDWILFNGSTITVIEVGEDCSSEEGRNSETNATERKKGHKVVLDKIEQIKKDQIIMNKFLTAVGAPEVTVNYLLVYPNLSMLEIKKDLLQCGFFEKIKNWKSLVKASEFVENMLYLHEKEAILH